MSGKKRALVIDDEETTVLLLENILMKKGFEVSVAPNGAAGLAHFLSADFDVVVLDLMMPVMSGVQFLEAVESLGESRPHSHGRVVVVHSSVTKYDELKDTLRYGCVYAVKPKPCQPSEIGAIVDCVLNDGVDANPK